jgi:hypothetical protein
MNMIFRSPKCVFVSDSFALAEVIVLWLAEQGIAADVMNKATLGDLDGLTWLSRTGIGAKGMEVWVRDIAQADQATMLVNQHSKDLAAARAAKRAAKGEVQTLCESCGETRMVPTSEAGNILTCENCGEYIDVPDPSADVDWLVEDDDTIEETDQATIE